MDTLLRLVFAFAIVFHNEAYAQAESSNDALDAEILQWSGDGISIQVKPLARDPVQAFLIGRGFASDTALHYASNCVFRVVVHYAADAPMSYDLRDWRIKPENGRIRPLKAREKWMEEWQSSSLDATARMGFEFSQLPTRQTLSKGDTVLGMNAAALPPGSRFDLILNWTVSGASRNAVVKGIRCRAP